MKTLIKIAIIAVMITAGNALKGQDFPKEYLEWMKNLEYYIELDNFFLHSEMIPIKKIVLTFLLESSKRLSCLF